jgi:hypothetical protein
MALRAEQKLRNIRTKVRLISDRIWRKEGWGVCTGDLERVFVLREIDALAGNEPPPLPPEVKRAYALRNR